ncbi:hypothetical protein [Vibrio phage BONAISHI]|nr:hypothetical protein [Vibrio phage BONAISHI]
MSTPPLNAVGLYEVASPFAVQPGAIYKCETIRGFDELEENDVDVYVTYYKPHGLTQDDYIRDRDNSEDIVYLMSLTADTLIIPSYYITKFPTAAQIPYLQTYLTFDLGLLPETFDVTGVAEYCKEALENSVGIDVSYRMVTQPTLSIISVSDHELLTKARTARQNIPDSHYKQNILLQSQLQKALQKVEVLQAELVKYVT